MRKLLLALSFCVAPGLSAAHASQHSGGVHLAKPPHSAPIYQYRPPAHLPPKSELPTPKNAVGQYFAVQSLSASQNVPTSHKPAVPNCTRVGYVNEYHYHWPTKAQSIQWWKAQPGSAKPGTYAYHVGSQISHQDAEGWILTGGCVRRQKPNCPVEPGWSGDYTWGGQWAGWQSHCHYTSKPSCPTGPGWTGNVTWNAPTRRWVKHCSFVSQPPCPHGAGWTGGYSWNGYSWVRGCIYRPRPNCPQGPGWTGAYAWSGATWVDHCVHHPRPSCPAGETGSYSWTGSAWTGHCSRPYNGCWTTPTTIRQVVQKTYTGVNSNFARYFFNGNIWMVGRINVWNQKSYDPNSTPVPFGLRLPKPDGSTITFSSSGRIRGSISVVNHPSANGNTLVCPCNPAGLPTSGPGVGNGYNTQMTVIGAIWAGASPHMVHEICYLPDGASGKIPGG